MSDTNSPPDFIEIVGKPPKGEDQVTDLLTETDEEEEEDREPD